MEKKLNLRTNQLPVKVLPSESRKTNQDASGKQQTRNLRRRDFSSNYSQQTQKTERSAHNVNYQHKQQQIFAPKSRNCDKRSTRSANDGYARNSVASSSAAASSGARLTHYDDDHTEHISDEFEAELNSVYLPGSKKQNLNHLLNFNYAPRERTDPNTYMRSGNVNKGHYTYVKRIKYNKEQFLQANCQFVVKLNGDYAPYAISPDLLVEWSRIEQIHLFGSTEEPQCPICLYHPVAAKMTRCGHVYCWPCILHYLALSDKKSWRKCPICYEAVHIGDLKSAISKPHRNYTCDESVTFQLMCRDKNSMQALAVDAKPAQKQTENNLLFPRLSDDAQKTMHSKLLLADYHEILSIIERERNELKCQLTSDGVDCPDSIFVQQALALLEERENELRSGMENDNVVDSNKLNKTETATIVDLNEALEKINLNASAKEFVPIASNDDEKLTSSDSSTTPTDESEDFFIDTESSLTLNDINIVPINTAANANRFYFYQASDGQHLYLHTINVRMLQSMYGSLENAPKQITGQIVQKESCSMTEELRKRLKYLQHLPVTCQFEVVEVQFEAPTISHEVLSKFNDELMQRKKNRQRRAREERKREKHIDRENERRIGKIIRTAVNIDVTSDQQFPICGSFDEPALPMHSPQTSSINDILSPVGSNPSTSHAGPSFAKMLTSPKNDALFWPSLARKKDVPLFATDEFQPLPSSNCFQAVSNAQPHAHAVNEHSDDDSVDMNGDFVDACAPPEFKESFGSAIAEALNNAAQLKNPRKQQMSSGGARNGGKKKKNNNKTVLFSTGGRTFDGN